MPDAHAPSATSLFEQRKLAHSQALFQMLEQTGALRARLGEKTAEAAALDAHDAMAKPWIRQPSPGQATGGELAEFPQLERFLDSAICSGVSDAHFSLRGDQVGLNTRAHGEMAPADPTLDPARVYSELLGLLRGKGISFPDKDHPSQAAPVIDASGASVMLRLQSMPVYPEGTDIIVRILPVEPALLPQMAQLRDAHDATRRGLLDQIRNRLLANRQEHQEECARSMDERDRRLHKELFYAIEMNQASQIAHLLEQGASPHWRQWRTADDQPSLGSHISMDTPLILAARVARAEIVQLLLPISDIDAVEAHGDTALIACSKVGRADIAQILAPLSLVDAQNFDGHSALAEAAWMDQRDVVRILAPLSDVNLGEHCFSSTPLGEPDPGRTALSVAAQEGYGPICETLLAHGADPRLKNKAGENAVEQGFRADDDLVSRLLEQSARLDELDSLHRETPPATLQHSGPRL